MRYADVGRSWPEDDDDSAIDTEGQRCLGIVDYAKIYFSSMAKAAPDAQAAYTAIRWSGTITADGDGAMQTEERKSHVAHPGLHVLWFAAIEWLVLLN